MKEEISNEILSNQIAELSDSVKGFKQEFAESVKELRHDLTEQIEGVARSVAVVYADVGEIKNDVGELKGSVAKLDQRVQGIENRFDDLAQVKASKQEVGELTTRVERVETHVGLASS